MANFNATRTTLNLDGNLNLDKNKAQVVTNNQFNEKNAPIYNGCLSPLYVNVEENVNGQYDEDGNLWTIRNGKLYKGDIVVSDNIFDSPYKREKLDYEVIWSRYQTFVEKNSHVVTEELVKVTLSGVEFKYKLDGEEKTVALPKGSSPTFRPVGIKDDNFNYCYCCVINNGSGAVASVSIINANTENVYTAVVNVSTLTYAFCNICVPYNAGVNQFSENGQFCLSLCTKQGTQIIAPNVDNILAEFNGTGINLYAGPVTFNYTNTLSGSESVHNNFKRKFMFIPGSVVNDDAYIFPVSQAEAFFIGKYNEEDTGLYGEIYLYGGLKINSISFGAAGTAWTTKTWEDFAPSYGYHVWSVNDRVFYSEGTIQKELNKNTGKWENITWNGLNNFYVNIGTDANCYTVIVLNDIAYLLSNYRFWMHYYKLNLDTMTWQYVETSWSGNTLSGIRDFWTDEQNIYINQGTDLSKQLNLSNNSWVDKAWNVPGGNQVLWGSSIKKLPDGNIYCINSSFSLKLTPNTNTWTPIDFTGVNGQYVWTFQGNAYYSHNNNNKKFNTSTLTWENVTFTGYTEINGMFMWNDTDNAYYSNGVLQYVLNNNGVFLNIRVTADATNDAERWFVDSGLTYADTEDSPVIASYTLYEGHYEQIVAVKKGEEIQTFIFSPNRALYNTGVIFTKGDSLESMDKDSIPSYGIGKTNRQLSNDVKYLGTGIILFNSNYITAIASGNGNLLSAWYDIGDKTPVFDNTNVYYVDSNGDSWKLTQGGTPYVKKIINNRYVLVASDGVYNVYDKVKGKLHNWTIAYNGNLKIGDDIPQTTTSNLTNGTCVSAEVMPSYKTMHIIGAAANPFFEVTKIPFTSSIFAQMNIYGITPELIKNCLFNPYVQTVDVFCSTADESTTAIYNFSFVGTYNAKINDVDLVDMYYPTTTILTIPFYADIIQTYNAYDFLKIGNNGYPIIYSNNKIILAYFSLSFVEDLDNIFVIQNTAFGVCDNKILRLDYSGYTLSGTQFIADVTGLTFVGSTPKQAIFYSPTKRQLYNFMGDCVLTALYDCGAIGEVITAQNAFLQNINYISLLVSMEEVDGIKQKLMFVGDSDMFAVPLEEFGITNRVERYTVTINNANASIIFSFFNSENKNTVVMLRFDNKEGFTCIPVNIKTGYNGTGNEGVNVVSCWYIRLLNYNGESGDIMRIAEKVITDIGTSVQTREVNISAADFDPLTGYYYIRYQPQAQRGIGVSLELKTKFPIYEVIAEWQADTTQLSGRNV